MLSLCETNMDASAMNTQPKVRQERESESPTLQGGFYSNMTNQPGNIGSSVRGLDVLGSTIIGSYFDSPRDIRPGNQSVSPLPESSSIKPSVEYV